MATRIDPGLLAALARSRHTVVLTGAGVSAESGIPTFRDVESGLWAGFRPEDLANPAAFERDPGLVWRWYQWRRECLAEAQPNEAHRSIAALERLLPRLTLVTQNVDGLHQLAGSHQVIEFHGNIHRNRCSRENRRVEIDVRGLKKPPTCQACGAAIRPDVVWFGESVPPLALQAATFAAGDCDVFMAVGTSAVVYPAAGLADVARDAGALLVEVNSDRTALTPDVDVRMRGAATTVMSSLVRALARKG